MLVDSQRVALLWLQNNTDFTGWRILNFIASLHKTSSTIVQQTSNNLQRNPAKMF
jgi:hypothetical protein